MKQKSIEWVEIEISKLIPAIWNYKSDDLEMDKKLAKNIERNDIVQNLIVRKLGDKFEVVNGNHRFKLIKEMGRKKVMCCNLGEIGEEEAMRIAYETNETNYETDTLKLADLIKKITNIYNVEDLLSTSPFNPDVFNSMLSTANFDVNNYLAHEGHNPEESLSNADRHLLNIPIELWNDFMKLFELMKDNNLIENTDHEGQIAGLRILLNTALNLKQASFIQGAIENKEYNA